LGNTLYEPLKDVALRYYSTDFLVDMIALIPWGYILAQFDPKLKVFWIVKAIRIG